MVQWFKKKKSSFHCRRCRFSPQVRKSPWRWKCQPTPGFLPGESQGQKSLVGYSPRGHHELDMTEQLTHTHKDVLVSPTKHWEGHKGHDMSAFCFKSSLCLLYGRFKWEILGCKETKWETITIIHVKDVGGFRLKQCQTKRKMNLRYI